MKRKENLNTLIAILIIVILIGFIWGYNILGIKTIINEGINKVQGLSLNANVNIECPKGIIPTEIDLVEYEGGLWGYEEWGHNQAYYYYWHPYWLDGQEMTLYPPTPEGGIDNYSRKYCVKGNKEGQNINNYYCKVGYSKTTIDISEEGEIGETKIISYLIELVLEKKEHIKNVKGASVDRYYVISSTCLKN